MKKSQPLLSQPRVQRVLYPVLIGVVLVALWQWMVVAMELPPYLVPSPILMVQTLVTDWVPLGNALLVTLKITLLSFALATVAGVLISFLFVQSKRIETALFPYAVLLQVTPIVAVAPLIIIWVKNPVAAMTRATSSSTARRAGSSWCGCAFRARCLTFSAGCAYRAAWR
jgi:NitT/TauT family transport system permease protein